MGLDPALFEGSVPKDLLCAMCGRVLVQPEMSTCQHVFCSSCLHQHVTSSCPTCGTWLQLTQHPPPSNLCHRLLDLRMRCDHKCGQVIHLGELPKHVSEECPNTPVKCPHATQGCKKQVKRCELDEHVQECEHRPVVCEACGFSTLSKDLLAHQSKRRCVELKLKHQLIQAVRLTRKDIRRHQKHLERQQVRIDQHTRRIELEHARKVSTARRLRQVQSNYNLEPIDISKVTGSSSSINTDVSNSERLPSRNDNRVIPAINKIPPSRISLYSRSGSRPTSKGGQSLVTTPRESILAVSRIEQPRLLQSRESARSEVKDHDGAGHRASQHAVHSGPRGHQPVVTAPIENSGLFLTATQGDETTEDPLTPATPRGDRERLASDCHQCRNCRKTFRENRNKANSCRWHAGPIIELFGGTCYSCGRLDFQVGCMMGFHEF